MTEKDQKLIVYRKLVRDKIPEIIRKNGKVPYTRKLEEKEAKKAIADKILEESFELFAEMQKDNKNDILKESADVLEIVLTALKLYGFNLDDLLNKMQSRSEKRGGFNDCLFLDQVGGKTICDADFQKYPAVVFNPHQKGKLINIIKGELKRSTHAWIASAFYSPGATNILLPELSGFIENGGNLKILLSTMGNVTRPEYFIHLKKYLPGSGLKVFHPPDIPFDQDPPNFHIKAWLFLHQDNQGSMITGSSNFTANGLKNNVEWNYFSSHEVNLPFKNDISPFTSARYEFEKIWEKDSVPVNDAFLSGYEQRRAKTENWNLLPSLKSEIFETTSGWGTTDFIQPNESQKEALDNLENLRNQRVSKAAVIAATGLGKTYLAAFDYKNSKSKSLLFIAHREDILVKARETFRKVLSNPSFGAIHGKGRIAPDGCSAVFAMIQTISRDNHLAAYLSGDFDYIVIDEFHHSECNSYQKVLNHFKPNFLLGLTATPERMDGRNVLAYCDYNIAYEVRVLEAINREWLVPFQYYATYDETDYEQITWRGTRYDEDELNRALQNDTRTAIIAHNLKKYLPATGKIKALAFCSSISHARFTAEKLSTDFDLPAVALWGETPDETRHQAIHRIQQENDPLNVICTVDIFNEGTDIPGLSHLLFLRPTQSFTLFLQQLGRGLRKHENKDFLVVLDFIGNFRKVHVAPLALCGETSIGQFIPQNSVSFKKSVDKKLPEGCFLSADIEVQRIWDKEIQTLIKSKVSKPEQLKIVYQDIKKDLGLKKSLNLMDMLSNAYGIDPYIYLKPSNFGNWLRAKKYCEDGNLSIAEEKILDTPGEYLLQHIETGMNPTKSYKMVVLLSLLKLGGTSWKIEEVAREFRAHYLKHSDQLSDYDALSKAADPEHYPLKSVVNHLKRMPLDKLSNKHSDCFHLDKSNGNFSLRSEYQPFWEDSFYRLLVEDRTRFVLTRYFRRSRLQQTIYFDFPVLSEGFPVNRGFAETFFAKKPLTAGESRGIRVQIGKKQYNAQFLRSKDGWKYRFSYGENKELINTMIKMLTPQPQKGDKIFNLVTHKNNLELIPVNSGDTLLKH